MQEQTRQTAFKNLMATAFLDGKLTSDEEQFLEQRRKQYKIKKAEYKRLLALIQNEAAGDIKLAGDFARYDINQGTPFGMTTRVGFIPTCGKVGWLWI